MPELLRLHDIQRLSIVMIAAVGRASALAQYLPRPPPRRADRRRKPCLGRAETGALAATGTQNSAMKSANSRIFMKSPLAARADGVTHARKTIARQQCLQIAHDPPGEARPFIHQRGG